MPTSTQRKRHKGQRQLASIAELLAFLRREFSKELGSSATAGVVYGCIDHDEWRKGDFAVTLMTALGDRLAGTVRPMADAQSGWVEDAPSDDVWAPVRSENEVPVATLWGIVQDSAQPASKRLEAVQQLLLRDKVGLLRYLAGLLSGDSAHDEEWVNTMVFFVEDVHFPLELRQSVLQSLLRIAQSRRSNSKAGAERVVWSAIRRAASLLAPTQANVLAPFLEREGVVDARAVALKCVERLFFPAPPADPDSVRTIGDRTYTLAEKFLDPDIFAGGEYALLALSAVCTLAAIGDRRLEAAIGKALQLNRRWLRHQLRVRLGDLRKSWQSGDGQVGRSPAFLSLETQLARLA